MPNQKSYYSDLDYRMRIDSRGNLVIHTNAECINQNIRSILATVSGERVRNNIGSALLRLLFEPISVETSQDLKFALKDALNRFEPRIDVTRIRVTPDFDKNEYDVQIAYKIKTTPQSSTFKTRLRSLQSF